MTKLSIFLALLIACMAVTKTTAQRPRYENPNLSVCARKKDLFSYNGNYVKTICMVANGVNYEEARRQCAANNMNLFIIDDAEVEALFFDGLMNILPDNREGFLWVNGKRQTFSNKWDVYNPDGSVYGPLYSGLRFYSQKAMGYCLQYYAGFTYNYKPLPANCNDGKYFLCEHHKRTEDPPRLDTTVCRHKNDLYSNGKYLKSFCVIIDDKSYDDARRKCASVGMNMFAFDSASVDEAFIEAGEEIFRTYPGGYFWINGQRECHSSDWNILNANGTIRGPLYHGIEWVSRGVCGRTSGICLKLTGQYGPFQAMGNTCGDRMSIICEYIK